MAFKEHILKVWKTFAHVGNPSEKHVNENMIIGRT
jgi:hypothetical protein